MMKWWSEIIKSNNGWRYNMECLEKSNELISKEGIVDMLLITSVINGIKHFFFRSDTHKGWLNFLLWSSSWGGFNEITFFVVIVTNPILYFFAKFVAFYGVVGWHIKHFHNLKLTKKCFCRQWQDRVWKGRIVQCG